MAAAQILYLAFGLMGINNQTLELAYEILYEVRS
jgi:hypothetical protein